MKTKMGVSGNTTRTLAVERVASMAGNHSTAFLGEVVKGMRDQALRRIGCCQERGENPHSLNRWILDLCLSSEHETKTPTRNHWLILYMSKEEESE